MSVSSIFVLVAFFPFLWIPSNASENNCSTSVEGYSLPCVIEEDPWHDVRLQVDQIVWADDPSYNPYSSDTQARGKKFKIEQGKTVIDAAVGIRGVLDGDARVGKKISEFARKATGGKGLIRKVFKAMATLASLAKFVGPILDIVLMFMPVVKSRELEAIEKGFAEMGGKLDAISARLERIEGKVEWNNVASTLIEFQSTVEFGMEKYNTFVSHVNESDPTAPLSSLGRNMIVDLVEYVKDSSNIGRQLQSVMNLILGNALATEKTPLLTLLMDANGNDCSQLPPFSNGLFRLVRDAQRLQYFYELSQGLINVHDDKGYPMDLHNVYTTFAIGYASCMRKAPRFAQEDAKILQQEGRQFSEILEVLNRKYDLYHWGIIKEDEYNKKRISTFSSESGAHFLNVELIDLADDRKKEQRMSLFAVPLSDETQIDLAIQSMQNVLQQTGNYVVKINGSTIEQSLTYNQYQEQIMDYARDAWLKYFNTNGPDFFNGKNFAIVMYDSSSNTASTGWHHMFDNLTVLHNYWPQQPTRETYLYYPERRMGIKFGISFNLNDNSDYNCENGQTIRLSFDDSFPYCLCDFGFQGDDCNNDLEKKKINTGPFESIKNIAEAYKIPGMFDIQDQIKEEAEKIMREVEKNKQEIFTEVRGLAGDIQENKNAVLSAQSIILNEMKSKSANLLAEVSGLKMAMEEYFRKERDERLYQTEKSEKRIIHTIIDFIAKETTTDLLKMDGRIIENRYFDDLQLHLPVFQEKFLSATANDSNKFKKEEFSRYLFLNKHDFYVSRKAIEHAITGKTDSFLKAQMKLNMINGCSEEYSQKIADTWKHLLELHFSTYVMESWELDYRINKNDEQASETDCLTANTFMGIGHLKQEKNLVTQRMKSESEQLKTAYQSSSCPEFTMPEIQGGGCKSFTTFSGQIIPMHCSDPEKYPILMSTSTEEVIEAISCTDNLIWNVDVTDIQCILGCYQADKTYGIGQKIQLSDPPSGFLWVNEEGEMVTEKICQLSLSVTSYHGNWSTYELIDIDECKTVDCGYDGTCVNTEGSYQCSCTAGFFENSLKVCEDLNECQSGEIGSVSCLVEVNLGTCHNNVGGYQCSCLPGAYASAGADGKSCSACQCNADGTRTCDGLTGECICHERVKGNECNQCQQGFTNFPHCHTCDVGYHGFPECNSCDCEVQGVSTEFCHKGTGRCICRPETQGTRCDRCCPAMNCENDYTTFPTCRPIIRDGTISSWGSWSSWTDLGSCGRNGQTSFRQTRYRTRRCNDATKNRHGSSCQSYTRRSDDYRDHNVCRQVTYVWIDVYDSYYAGTSGKLSMWIRQGSAQCQTYSNTFDAPGSGVHSRSGRQGCSATFDYTRPVEVKITSDSGNDVYLEEISVQIGGNWKEWYASGYIVVNKHGRGVSWRQTGN